jgi:NADH-quinone oxidoreductase subunit D
VSELKTLILGRKDQNDPDDYDGMANDLMTINMGPSHPAMHGTIKMVLTVDGERIVHADINPGYLHRGFEKESEHATYTQIFPYTDRLNYVSPMINNVGWAMAVEKLMGITELPERLQYIRVMISEISRITDHLTCVGASAMELGAFTPFLYMVKAREWFYELLEELSGARLTHSYVRVGGVSHDLTTNFRERLTDLLDRLEETLVEATGLLNGNKIFYDRMADVGVLSKEDAISYGLTGPCLRACGVDYDVRKDFPYLNYDKLEFDVPVGSSGDCLDRYCVRMEEIKQSTRILRQCIREIPEGPVCVDDPRCTLPDKQETYNTIEGMIRHFKHIVDGIKVDAGEAYTFVEGGNGELGFFVVADGTGRPWKNFCRAPSFINLQTIPKTIDGLLISDIVPIFGMINMIGGECDK